MKFGEALVPKVKIEAAGITIDRYIVFDPDRHGNPRYYFRRKGCPKVRLHAVPGSQEFLEEFRAACNGRHPAQRQAVATAAAGTSVRRNAPPGTLAWLLNEYERRAKSFLDLDPSTKQRRRVVLDEICAEPTSENDAAPIGLRPFKTLRLRVLNVICDRCKTPDTANARVKALRVVMKFAVAEEWLDFNPARDLEYRKSSSTGYHSWTVEEVEQYERRWAIGTVQRLALGILLYTGDRSSDAVVLGKQHRRDATVMVNSRPQKIPGWQFTQFKGRNKSPTTLWLPILQPLQDIIDATPSKGLTYLETFFGNPFTRKGFGTQFKRWCKLAGLPHCSAHGVRKAGATVAADRGASPYSLMAIFGWKTLTQALGYTKAAEQKRLAAAAMHLLAERDESVSPSADAVG
jgi:integrase